MFHGSCISRIALVVLLFGFPVAVSQEQLPDHEILNSVLAIEQSQSLELQRVIKVHEERGEGRYFDGQIRRLQNRQIEKETRPVDYKIGRNDLEISVVIPSGGMLHTAVGCHPLLRDIYAGTLRLEIVASLAKNSSKVLFTRQLDPGITDESLYFWDPVVLDLSIFEGRKITIRFSKSFSDNERFVTRHVYDLVPTDFVFWAKPVVRPATQPDKKNLILLSIDTLSAKHLGMNGYHRDTSPNLDEFARNGCFFSTVVSQAPWTMPSHFSILTGTYPRVHGMNYHIQSGVRRFDGRVPLLAELLRDQGYLTVAFTGSGSISAAYGFDRGFDFYNESPVEYHDAEIIFGRAKSWLRDNHSRTFFMFLHTYQVHGPWINTFFEYKENIPNVGLQGNETPEQIRLRTARYDSDIREMDDEFAKLLDELKSLDLLDNTLIVVTADHGEDMGGRIPPGPQPQLRYGHGMDLDDSQILVPLIFHGPGIPRRTEAITTQVRSIDIAPTIVDYLRIPSVSTFHGVSLREIMEGRDATPRPAFTEATTYGTDRISLRKNMYKYIRRTGYGTLSKRYYAGMPLSPPHELYDLQSDERELNNLAESNRPMLLEMINSMQKLLHEVEESMNTQFERRYSEVERHSDELLNELKSLGYIQ